MKSMLTTYLESQASGTLPENPPRCKDCDEDCWKVKNKTRCWAYDPSKGFCPWLHPGIEFPPTA